MKSNKIIQKLKKILIKIIDVKHCFYKKIKSINKKKNNINKTIGSMIQSESDPYYISKVKISSGF